MSTSASPYYCYNNTIQLWTSSIARSQVFMLSDCVYKHLCQYMIQNIQGTGLAE